MPTTRRQAKLKNAHSGRQSIGSELRNTSRGRSKPTPRSAKLHDKLVVALRQAFEVTFKQDKSNFGSLDFAAFYSLIDAVLHDSFLQWPAIINIYHHVVSDLLKVEVAKLMGQDSNSDWLITSLESIWCMLSTALESKFLGIALAYVEKTISLDIQADKTMLFHEKTCTLFVDKVIYHPQIVAKLKVIRFAYINLVRDEMKKRLVAQHLQQQQNSVAADEVLRNEDKEKRLQAATIRLLQLLTKLESEHRTERNRLFERPLIEESVIYGQAIVDELIDRLEAPAYLCFVDNFLAVNRALLESLFPISPNLAGVYITSLGHFLLTASWPRLVAAKRLNFGKFLADYHSAGTVASIFKTLSHISETMKEKRLMGMLLELVDEYLDELQQELRHDYSFETRGNMIDFVVKFFELKDHLDCYLTTTFNSNPHVGRKFVQFYVQTLQSSPSVAQALAYAIFDLFCREQSLLFTRLAPKLLAKGDEPIVEDSPAGRLSLAENFFALVVYLKDHNDFIDYVKHYFGVNLLHQQGQDATKVVGQSDRLAFFDRLLTHINQIITKPGSEVAPYAYFIENLKVFHLIEKDFRESTKGFETSRTALRKLSKTRKLSKAMVLSLKGVNILHGIIWKTTDFEQCLLPPSMATSWMAFVEAFNSIETSRGSAQKRLALNTKHSIVTVETKFGKRCARLDLTLSVHQMAIIECFNDTDRLKYCQIHEATKFSREANLQLAILSLVFGDLLRCHLETKMHVDDNHPPATELILTYNDLFHELYVATMSQQPIQEINLAGLEATDFWTLEAGNLVENFMLAYGERVGGQSQFFKYRLSNESVIASVRMLLAHFNLSKDIGLQLSAAAVEARREMHQTITNASISATSLASIITTGKTNVDSISLRSKSRKGKSTRRASKAALSSVGECSTSSNRGKTRKKKRRTKMISEVEEEEQALRDNSSGGGTTVKHPESAIDLEHKLECALVRLLKRERYLPSVGIIHRKLIESMKSNPKAGLSRREIDAIAVGEVRRILDGLVARAFLVPHLNGGYNYII